MTNKGSLGNVDLSVMCQEMGCTLLVGRGNARRKSVPRFFVKLCNLQIDTNKNFEI